MPTVYNFEAQSIQSYILDSSKLKDMIGASEQIEYLCCENGLLDQVLECLNLDATKVQFTRRAGGAFQAIFSNPDDVTKFQSVWTFCVQQAVPGLTFAQSMETADTLKEAIDSARQTLFKHDHNVFFPTLPLAGPLIARSQRTGLATVSKGKFNERLDMVTKTKRRPQFRKSNVLTDKLIKIDGKRVRWPINLDDKDQEDDDEDNFPLLKHNRYIGIVHADGNNLGYLLKQLQETISNPQDADMLLKFSDSIKETIERSAQEATIQVLIQHATDKRVMPARPLVLGGDDLTFIVRGDLALGFTKVFLEEFEQRSKEALAKLTEKYPELAKILPEQLTACAGIAYIKASQPFYQGYHLADSLCNYAKRCSKDLQKGQAPVPSSIAFHRITTSIINDNYINIIKDELTIGEIQNTMQPYLVGEVEVNNPDKCVDLDDLDRLSQFLAENTISHGTVREYLSVLQTNPQLAEQTLIRWYDNMVLKPEINVERLKGILETLVKKPDEEYYKNNPSPLKFIGNYHEKKCTPIGDALALLQIRKISD